MSGYKEIILHNGEVCLVDADMHEKLSMHKWHLSSNKASVRRYQTLGGKIEVVMIHREVIQAKAGEIVDHINGNVLDNRLDNLRLCSHAENMRNRKMHSNNKLGVKGVYFGGDRYIAEVKLNKKKHKRVFRDIESAKEWVERARKELHADFCRN